MKINISKQNIYYQPFDNKKYFFMTDAIYIKNFTSRNYRIFSKHRFRYRANIVDANIYKGMV